MTNEFGLLDVAIGGAAALTVLVIAVVLQRAGLSQPFALAIAVPCGLLAFYPVMRRRSRRELPFYKWGIVALAVALAGLLLDLLVVHL
jgi:4-hydroxybenzoate polyprenyltransferase